MESNPLYCISPIDGRYQTKVAELKDYFSEYSLIKFRLFVEINYIKALFDLGLEELKGMTKADMESVGMIFNTFNINDCQKIKKIEGEINHDVKAVEYYIKDKMESLGLSKFKEFVHFGLTSQDINNTAFPLMLKDALTEVVIPSLVGLVAKLRTLAERWKSIPMLAHTHGQPASPTTVGKEIYVFVERLELQLVDLDKIEIKGKFGGATGNFNAHKISYPNIDWKRFSDNFLNKYLKLSRSQTTTQIDHYDSLSQIFDCIARINNILIDLCRDMWTYISMDYFKLKLLNKEVGSSAMPHKINPIDFENAEGNLMIANVLLRFLSEKLPVSRLQRDLTDSTVLRNIGVPIAHSLLAFKSLEQGLTKIDINHEKLDEDLESNWAVVSEAIQTILRKISYLQPYESLKSLTRGNNKIGKAEIHAFIDSLSINEEIKDSLKKITPQNYIGYKFDE